jgi:hypothetical protein
LHATRNCHLTPRLIAADDAAGSLLFCENSGAFRCAFSNPNTEKRPPSFGFCYRGKDDSSGKNRHRLSLAVSPFRHLNCELTIKSNNVELVSFSPSLSASASSSSCPASPLPNVALHLILLLIVTTGTCSSFALLLCSIAVLLLSVYDCFFIILGVDGGFVSSFVLRR